MDILIPADIEYITQEYLRGVLPADGMSAVVTTAFEDADLVVHLFTTGGDDRTIVSGQPRVVFDCYGRREAQAQRLAAITHGRVKDMDSRVIGGTQIYDVTATLPSNYPHPDRPDYFRYQFNALIHARHVGTN